ncbi:MAG: tRNA uridine-5-carboxymethylaminomethyl(34) synthesis GTPase MnmE [Pseudomonadota bacterium]
MSLGHEAETIYALASGAGRAAVAVLRLSGPRVPKIVATIVGKDVAPRKAVLATFRDPATSEAIDRGLCLVFPAPASFTGEDCAEFHLHGGLAVVAAMLAALARFPGTRPAEAGEFTRRAFENGKLDLSEVEGLADLIEAETDMQRRQALRQARGTLRHKVEAWRQALLEASALLEAEIDFADEGDVAPLARKELAQALAPVRADLTAALAQGRAGEIVRDGVTVVIAGPPNAGKSTLLNTLARREAAIVSPIPGTTRDAIEVHLDIAGFAFVLIDTAGLRETADPVESIGVARTRARVDAADLVLWLSETSAPAPADLPASVPVWPIHSKSDLDGGAPSGGLAISAMTGANLDRLIEKLAGFVRDAAGQIESGLITRERHRRAFEKAAAALDRAGAEINGPVELLGEDLRTAIRALESLIGRIDVEDVLGEIFARFCIGK